MEGYPESDGFASPRVFEGGRLVGYDLYRPRTGIRLRLADRMEAEYRGFPDDAEDGRAWFLGPYRFESSAFASAFEAFKEALAEGRNPLFIDEAGPLELAGRGFAAALRLISDAGRDLFLVVRESLVGEVTDRFGISDYELISA
jgi:nucleoside-triphosphatase THEP1